MDSRRQRLDLYRLPADYSPGASRVRQMLWFCLGAPLLSARWCPGSLWRCQLLRAFGAAVGPGCRIKPGLRVKFPWRLSVGEHSWLGEDVWIDNLAPVWIGSQVCLSQGAYLCTGNHDFTSPGFDLRCGAIRIGDGAWIGAMARLAPGVEIGSDAVVCLGAVVFGFVPPSVVIGGHPAQPIRTRW
ncbi:MAG: WcaF family extracellular polysaccharide biosynthesis acetyltransferase [Cyanobium sp.]|nr:WcaF family extracellular polysaccharide biosynthesis acetyltransferase [Cyanobium sp.]